MLKNKISALLIILTIFCSQNILAKKFDELNKKQTLTKLKQFESLAREGKLARGDYEDELSTAIDEAKEAMSIPVYKIRSEALRVLKAILKNDYELNNNDYKEIFESYIICMAKNKNPITKVRALAGLKRLYSNLGSYMKENDITTKNLLVSNKIEPIKSDQPILFAYSRTRDQVKTDGTFMIIGFIFKLLGAMLSGIANV